MYNIDEQKDGRGEDAEMVLIKQVKRGVATDKSTGKIGGMFPLKSVNGNQLPCLKVKLSSPEFPGSRFEVRWSNYYEQFGNSPGKFKLVRVDIGQPLFLWEHDINGRKIVNKRTGKNQIDFVGMAMRFGSEPIWSDEKYPKVLGWEFGQSQPFSETTVDMFECESFDHAETLLTDRFGESLTTEILMLFVTQELFCEFVSLAA